MASGYPIGKEDLAARIRRRRLQLYRDRGMTQEVIARALGMSRGAYSRWETGSYSIRAEDLPRLARALEVPLEFFFDGGESVVAESSGAYSWLESLPADSPSRAAAESILRSETRKWLEAMAERDPHAGLARYALSKIDAY